MEAAFQSDTSFRKEWNQEEFTAKAREKVPWFSPTPLPRVTS